MRRFTKNLSFLVPLALLTAPALLPLAPAHAYAVPAAFAQQLANDIENANLDVGPGRYLDTNPGSIQLSHNGEGIVAIVPVRDENSGQVCCSQEKAKIFFRFKNTGRSEDAGGWESRPSSATLEGYENGRGYFSIPIPVRY